MRDVKPPKKKAKAFVNEVIVIEGPACDKPTVNLFSAVR